MKQLTATSHSLISNAILLLRIITGLILFVAGAGKVAGWFGGMGMETTLQVFKNNMNMGAPLVYLSSYAEFIGGFFLIIGFMTRPAAIALTINMLVATLLVGPVKFFMGGGAYPCQLMISALVILLAGPMAYSIDAWLQSKKRMPSFTKTGFLSYGGSF